MSGRVRIGTAADPADAALIRSVFAARGLGVVIGAEHHASLLGPIGGAFLSLDIWVAAEDAEEAVALLRDLREGAPADGSEADAAPPDGEDDAPPDAGDEDDDELDHERRIRAEQRRRAGVAILLGCFLTFGTAHIVTGAWARGLVLAAIEIAGIRFLVAGEKFGTALILAAVITDLIGALWRLRVRRTLPTARIHRG